MEWDLSTGKGKKLFLFVPFCTVWNDFFEWRTCSHFFKYDKLISVIESSIMSPFKEYLNFNGKLRTFYLGRISLLYWPPGPMREELLKTYLIHSLAWSIYSQLFSNISFSCIELHFLNLKALLSGLQGSWEGNLALRW